MSHRSKGFVVLCALSLRALVACGSDAPPAGSCHTGGPATGSFAPGCSECGRQKCDAELRDKAGSGYAQGYWGGDGACAAFNECTCHCLASATDPLSCAISPMCLTKMTPACQAAVQKANDCIDQNCATECR
jgi:hypothetical protein